MIFYGAEEYYMYLGCRDAEDGILPYSYFFAVQTSVSERCYDAYLFGYLMVLHGQQ